MHWIRDVLVWTKAPFLFRNEILATDGSGEPRPARPDEVKRLGDNPVVVPITIGNATVEIAAHDEDRELIHGPPRNSAEAADAAPPPVRPQP